MGRNNDTDTGQSPSDGSTTPTKPSRFGVFNYQANENVTRFMSRYNTEIASASSSTLSTFVAFPLDFAKARMQSYETRFLDTIKDAYKTEGLRGFWRGVSTPLFSVTLVRTVSFSLYQKSKGAINEIMAPLVDEAPLSVVANGKYPNFATVTCFGLAGASAGALITFISCPFELIKLRAQLAGKMAREANPTATPVKDLRTGAFRTAQQLIRERGIRGVYCGYRLHFVRDTIGTAIYFGTYESVKQLLSVGRINATPDPAAVAFAGATCGIVSWALIYPIDVVKTVYQKHQLAAGNSQVTRPDINFFKMGSYRGLGVSMMRSALINMIFFSSFEQLKKRITTIDD